MPRSRHHALFAAVAVFLLLFTAADLAYPAMCTEDGGDDSTFAVAQGPLTIGAPASSSDAGPAPGDDCFCCCAHVIGRSVFYIAMPRSAESARFDLAAERLSVAQPVAFRPPKTA